MNFYIMVALEATPQTALNLVGAITILFVLAIGIIYLKTLTEISNLEGKAKNQGANLDTLIWDMDFTRKKAVTFLSENHMEIPDDMKKEPVISLGMNSASQIYNYKMMKDAENAFLAIIKDHPDIVNERAQAEIIDKYEELEKEITSVTYKYNNAVKAYNTCLDRGVAHTIASHSKKRKKGYFRPEYAINNVVEIDE